MMIGERQKHIYVGLLTVIALLLGYLNYQILKPFLVPVSWAVIFSIIYYPLYILVLRVVRARSLASLIVVALVLATIIGPFSYLTLLLVQELGDLIGRLNRWRTDGLSDLLQHPTVKVLVERGTRALNIGEEEASRLIIDNLAAVGKELIGRITRSVRDIVGFGLSLLFMAISTFFLLKECPSFFVKVRERMPFPRKREQIGAAGARYHISTMYGGVIVAVIQGLMGGITFSLLGISSPALWGFAMGVASFLPLIGPFIIWVPAAFYLVFHGFILKAIVLMFVGIFVISGVDNILRPIIVGRRTRMPYLALFFSVLGGIKFFGLLGFIVGPWPLQFSYRSWRCCSVWPNIEERARKNSMDRTHHGNGIGGNRSRG